MSQLKTYQFRLYPTTVQVEKMENTLDTCRFLYNDSLADRKNAYERTGITVGYYDQQYELKNREGIYVHSQVAQDVLRRLQKAHDNFFRRVKNGETPGYPRFQGKNRYNSFTYSQSGFKLLDDGKIKLSKIGVIKVKQHRDIGGKIKTCTISRDVDQWYVNFSCEIDSQPCIMTGNSTGIDLGLESLITLSDGEKIKPQKYLRQSEQKLAHAQRDLSRKKKGSNNIDKQREKVAKIHRHIRNQRKDNAHKISKKLVDSHDTIVFEDLRIQNMVKNHHLSKSILDAGWNQLVTFTAYKAEYAGKIVKQVDPKYTSMTCSTCGHIQKMPLSARTYKCPACNMVLDRDVNAAINIKRKGLGQELAEITPVEMLTVASMTQEAPCVSVG